MKEKIVSIVERVIAKSVFDEAIYTEIMKKDLEIELESIYKSFDIEVCNTMNEIIERISDFLESKVKVREEYYCAITEDDCDMIPKSEMIYRTAYAALIRGEATSIGIAEAAMMILSLYDIESEVLLSTFENSGLFEYVTVAKYIKDFESAVKVIDVLRKRNCKIDLKDYKTISANIVYARPNSDFLKDKIGKNGFGISFDEYKKNKDAQYVIGEENLYKII